MVARHTRLSAPVRLFEISPAHPDRLEGSSERRQGAWAAVVAALHPACAAYARFKFAKPPTSLWRMF